MRDPTRQAERLMAIRLRYTINTHLEDQGITAPAAIGAAAGLPAATAVGLLLAGSGAPATLPRCRPWPTGSGCRCCRRTPASCGGRAGPVRETGGAVGRAWAAAKRLPRPDPSAAPAGTAARLNLDQRPSWPNL